MPKINTEYPAIYAPKDVFDSVIPPITNDTILVDINALYIYGIIVFVAILIYYFYYIFGVVFLILFTMDWLRELEEKLNTLE